MTTTNSDPFGDLPSDKLERAMVLQNGLLSLCEGRGGMDNAEYQLLRRELMNDPAVSSLVPQFVRTNRDTDAMWAFFKSHAPKWETRRNFVREQFAPLIDRLESGQALADDLISRTVISFDAEGIKDAWDKALGRRENDPAGAITAARTLLESVCKHLLEDEAGNVSYRASDDLPKLYRLAAEKLNIAPSQHSQDAFKRILGGATSVVEGLGTLRNKIGDSHAPDRKAVKPAPRHAALAVNMAGSMALFLIETAKAKQGK